MTPSDPVRYTTLDPNGDIWDFPIKKHGGQKTKWMAEVITLGLMALSTMVIGSNQKCMGKEFLN